MLTDRQMLILRMIVEDYVRSVEPVGSRTISKHSLLGLSAATIRNEMADLEELGYLEQPHTSAGRIPSQLGYRFYVDHLLAKETELDASEVHAIKSLFSERISEMEQIAQQTALILSGLTQYTGLVLGPQIYDTTLKSLQIIPLTERTAVVLVVTSSGQVQNKTVSLPEGISMGAVENLVNLLNSKLIDTPMFRMRSRMFEEIMREVSRHMEDYEEAIRLLDEVLRVIDEKSESKVYLGGATNMLLQPEFKDVEKVRAVLSWFEQPDFVKEVLTTKDRLSAKLQVQIGAENDVQTLQECSLITATYHSGDIPIGVIGIVGPTRMEYARVIRLLNHVANNLTKITGRFPSG